MAKYKFTLEERYAVYTVLDAKCIWCTKPLHFRDCTIDHVLPESLNKAKLKELADYFKLSGEFEINSFYNWAPMHARCNEGKSAKIFKTPLIMEKLHYISTRVPEIKALHQKELDRKREAKQYIQSENETGASNKQNSKLIQKAYGCKTTELIKSGSYGERSPKQHFEIIYERINSKSESLSELNTIFRSEALSELMGARDHFFRFLQLYEESDPFAEMDSTHHYWMNFSHASANFISYTSTLRTYATGTIHEQYGVSGHSYYLNPLRKFLLNDVISNYDAFIEKITPLAYQKMVDEIKLREPEVEVTDNFPIEKDWLTPQFGAFNNYHFTQTGLVFIFNPYQVSAWVYGAHFPEFSFEELEKLFPEENQLIDFLSSLKAKPKRQRKK